MAMRRRTVLFFGLMLAALIPVRPGRAVEAETRHRSVLEGVTALDKPVTYSETKIPLGELVQKVAADTGAPLTAAREVSDEPVAVVVKAMPARELLEQLADLLDYRWRREDKPQDAATAESERRFEIWQDLAGKQREAALREARLTKAMRRFQEMIREHVEVAALSQERIDAALQAAQRRDQEMSTRPLAERLALAGSPAEQALQSRRDVMHRLSSPVARAMMRLVGRLSPEQWALLREGEPITFSTDPLPEQPPLPADIAQLFHASPLEMHQIGEIRNAPPGFEDQLRQRQKDTQAQWAAATGYRVRVSLASSYFKRSGSLVLNVHVAPLSGREPAHISLGTEGLLSLPVGADADQEQRAEDTPQRRAELEKDPVFGVPKTFKPKNPPRPELMGPGNGAGWWLRDMLPDLARVYGVDFLADAYGKGPVVTPEELDSVKAPALWEMLNHFAGSYYRWDRREKLVRLRDRSWLLDRPQEIPLRLIRRWKELYDKQGALPLDEYVRMASELKDEQFQGLEGLERELPMLSSDVGSVPYAPDVLRLYASLSTDQRQALWHGSSLAVTRMLPAQRRLFLAVTKALNGHHTPRLTAAQALAGSLSLTRSHFVRVRQPGGDPNDARIEPAIPPDGAAPPVPTGAGSGSQEAGPGRNTAIRRPVTRIDFQFSYGPDTSESIGITVATTAQTSPGGEGARAARG